MVCIMVSATAACGVVGIVEPLLPRLITHHHPAVSDQSRDRLWAMGASFYPLMIVLSGYVSDRVPRHRVLQAGLLGFAALLPMWSLARGNITTVVVYVAFVFGFDAVVDAPVQPLIASVVDELKLGEDGVIAFTLGEVAQNFGHLFGPGLSIWLSSRRDREILEHHSVEKFEKLLFNVQLVVSAIFLLGFLFVVRGFAQSPLSPQSECASPIKKGQTTEDEPSTPEIIL